MNKPDKKDIKNTSTVQSIYGFCAHQGDVLKVQEYFSCTTKKDFNHWHIHLINCITYFLSNQGCIESFDINSNVINLKRKVLFRFNSIHFFRR